MVCKSLVILVATVVIVAPPAVAQFAYLDANGDGVWTSGDRMGTLGVAKAVDVYIVTNHNANGSTATCNSGGDSLSINSYVVNLRATGGTVTFSGFTNRQSGMSVVATPEVATSTEWKGGRGGGAILSPGTYRLMTITATVTSGAPTLSIIPLTSFNERDVTSFGTACLGLDLDNTYKLGVDWADVAGLAQPSFSLVAPDSVAGSVSQPILFDVASDSALTLLQAVEPPPGATFTPIQSTNRGTFAWVPEGVSPGTYDVAFMATSSAGAASKTTRVTVQSSGAPRKPWVARSLRNLQVGSRDYYRLLENSQGGMVLNTIVTGNVSDQTLTARGVQILCRSGNAIVIRCPYDSLQSLYDTPGLEAVNEPEFCTLATDSSTLDIGVGGLRCVDPNVGGSSVLGGQTGAGVVVGIVDTGIDVKHSDFKNFAERTRIVGYWDESAPSGIPPIGFGGGREYSSANIDAGNVDANANDVQGHGTHVAGIAAGNGLSGQPCKDKGKYVGVAPGASLCVVKLPFNARAEANVGSVIAGIRYIFAKADTLHKPAVVNLSLGTHAGPHNGNSLFDQYVGNIINGLGPGHIVVAAAGNEANAGWHATTALHNVGAIATATLEIPEYDPVPDQQHFLHVHAWMSNDDEATLRIVTPNGYSIQATGQAGQSTPDGNVSWCVGATCTSGSGFEHNTEFYVQLLPSGSSDPAQGLWNFEFTPVTIVNGLIDLYLEDYDLGSPSPLVRFNPASPARTVRSPADHDSVVAVGAYTTRETWPNVSNVLVGDDFQGPHHDIAPYSSLGPRRDGAIKPDITAPGAVIVSSLSRSAAPYVLPESIVLGDSHFVLSGTSMAAPHVTGAVALLLAQPGWATATPTQILSHLRTHSRNDAFTGTGGLVPNFTWGYGKLDVRSALGAVPALRILYPPKGTTVTSRWGRTDILPEGGVFDSIRVDLSIDGCSFTKELAVIRGVPSGTPVRVLYAATDTTARARVRAVGYKGTTIVEAFSDSLFRLNFTQTAGVDAGAPLVFAVYANRPNPFNPRTTITFDLPKLERVGVRIYSVDGRLVRTVIDKSYGPGRHTVEWDGTDRYARQVSSGIYLYEVTADGERSTRKMTLLK